MKNFLQTILGTWFVGRNGAVGRDSAVMEYFRSEFKQDAAYAYEYWKSTGKMNFSL